MPALNFDKLNKNICRTIIGNELNFQRTISYIKKIILTMIIHAKDKDQKINDECKKSKKILVSAAISQFDGHLYKFNFKKRTSCYRCFMPDKPVLEKNCETDGIFSPVAGVLGSLQANEVLKSILGLKNGLDNQMMIFNSIKINLRKVKLSLNPECKNKC